MKNIWKYIFIGLGTVVFEWVFLSVFFAIFNGLSQTEGVVIGVSFFLAFEMVICTGSIISRIEKRNDDKQNN